MPIKYLILVFLVSFLVFTLFLAQNGKMKKEDSSVNKGNLTDLQYKVTQKGATERAFENEYWDNYEPGIYVDLISGDPLFSSLDKYDSGTGWPSFTKPIDDSMIVEKEDNSLLMKRTEVKSADSDSHLGHVFDDGPDGGERFCINSAALKFIHYNDLEKEGYGDYKELFPYEEAVLAGGCFWGVEYLLQETEGIISATSGYSGGTKEEPTYREVSSGKTGHAEAVLVIFDPAIISYSEVLDLFWRLHDPTQENRQGPDIGTQYRSAIFYLDEEQKKIAEESKMTFDAKGIFENPAVTEIVPFEKFYPAEDYHQDYVENNPGYICHALRDE